MARSVTIGSATKAKKPREKPGRYWAKFGAIATALGIVVTLAIAFWSSRNPSTPSETIGPRLTGDCNAVGAGAAACVTLSPYKHEEFAGAVIGREDDVKTYIYPGSLSKLPPPPNYDPSFVRDHCDEWDAWIKANKLYAKSAELLVQAQTGAGETLSVTDVSVQVLSRMKPEEITEIGCGFGAGSVAPGSDIEIDTRTGKAKVARGDYHDYSADTNWYPMPPAQIKLDSPDTETITIRIYGEEGMAYSGIVTIRLMVNGEQKVAVLGSISEPYRWMSLLAFDGGPSDKTWNWNPLTHKWTHDAKGWSDAFQ